MKPGCRIYRDQFIEAFYDELKMDQRESFEAHLKSCSDCSAEFEKLAAALKIMDRREHPQPEESFWENYWDNLTAKLETSAQKEQLVAELLSAT